MFLHLCTIATCERFSFSPVAIDFPRLFFGISEQGDLLLFLELPVEMPEPVYVFLRFADTNTSEVSNLTIPREKGFMGTRIITDVDNSELPFITFTVRLAMMISGVVGDFAPESQPLGEWV